MRIAFFGSSLLSAYWNGAATYYRGIIKELFRLGHTVTFYEPDAYDRQKHRDLDPPDWSEVVVYQSTADGALEAIKAASQADVLVKAGGVGVHDELLECEILNFKKPENLIIYWDVDAPATLERIEANPNDHLKPLIPEYDAVLTYGGGSPVVQGFTALGAKVCVPIYNALDPETHFPVKKNFAFAADLSFMGNRLPDREERVEEFFFDPAWKKQNKRFLLGGNGWADKLIPENVNYIGHVYTCNHNCLNSSCLAALNINRSSMARFGFSPPTRVFEAAGAAACIITDAWPGIDDFLEPEKEILVAESGNQIGDLLDRLTPELSKQIGLAGRRRILDHHTYKQRAVQADKLLRQLVGS